MELESRCFYLHVHMDANSASFVVGQMHARKSTSGTLHQGSKPQCNSFLCSYRPHRPDQEQKARVLLHHASKIASTQIQWLCRRRHALTLPSRLSKQCASYLHSDHGSPKMRKPPFSLDHSLLSYFILRLQGVACSHKTREGGASPARLDSDVTPINCPLGA